MKEKWRQIYDDVFNLFKEVDPFYQELKTVIMSEENVPSLSICWSSWFPITDYDKWKWLVAILKKLLNWFEEVRDKDVTMTTLK